MYDPIDGAEVDCYIDGGTPERVTESRDAELTRLRAERDLLKDMLTSFVDYYKRGSQMLGNGRAYRLYLEAAAYLKGASDE